MKIPDAKGGEMQMEQKSRIIAGILGIYLGAFGIHNFYLGKTNRAVTQIVVTCLTCGLGGLWGMIEGILIMMKNPSLCTDANHVPLYESQRYQLVAGLLGIFLGGFGAHNFYLGKNDIAIIQLVLTLCSGGIGTLWGLVEGVMILFGSPAYQQDADGNPLIRI